VIIYILPTLVFFLLILALAIGLRYYVESLRQINATFSRISRNFQGTYLHATPLRSPSIRFTHRDFPVDVEIVSLGNVLHPLRDGVWDYDSTYFTQLRVASPQIPGRFEVYPDQPFLKAAKFLGTHDIELGDPRFDSRYIIRGAEPKEIRDLLNADLRSSIDQLRSLTHHDDVYVLVTRGRLLIKRRGYLREPALLEQFIHLGLQLFDYLLLAGCQGIEFVAKETQPDTDTAICQICGEDINRDAVYCLRCKTPHHGDCWQYVGACSTYGCGEKRFTHAKRVR
jgi:hypothetical protein